MADINEFIKKLGDDISVAFAPKIEAEVVQVGNQIADRAAPKVHDFANQLAPKVQDFANQLIREIFTQQSAPIRDFVIGLVQNLVGRYQPTLAGNLHMTIVEKGLLLASNDLRLEMTERATGRLVTSLDLPISFPIEVKQLFVTLDSATTHLEVD